MLITILAMINPFTLSFPALPLQAHSWLEIQASFRLIPHWTRLDLYRNGSIVYHPNSLETFH
jgi:hypothetical protein